MNIIETVEGVPLPKDAKCVCVKDHRPHVLNGEWHHVWPLGMGGPNKITNMVFICPTTHSNTHDILRLMVRDHRYWTWPEVVERFEEPVSRYAFRLALLGYRRWDQAGGRGD